MPESHVVGSVTGVGDTRNSGSVDGPPRPVATLVVPTRGAAGKSRLVPPPGVRRSALARAMALDTVRAAVACPLVGEVVVVTSDAEVIATLPPGARALPDPGAGLAAAVAAGLTAAAADPAGLRASGPDEPAPGSPRACGVVGVLLGDLPALTPGDLATALVAAGCLAVPDADRESDAREPGAAFVPDRAGSGTVLLVGRSGRLWPAFGAGSAARHARWARRLDLDLPRLRCDVDDAADLALALSLGVGPATRAVLGSGRATGGP